LKFCPDCGARLRPKPGETVTCLKCGKKVKGGGNVRKEEVVKQVTGSGASLKVMDEKDAGETLPTISMPCPSCGHGEAVWWMLQTRSADEATTQFFRCTKCSHTWRNYS
jgi:DNA-directed RNA polymerase subunit M